MSIDFVSFSNVSPSSLSVNQLSSSEIMEISSADDMPELVINQSVTQSIESTKGREPFGGVKLGLRTSLPQDSTLVMKEEVVIENVTDDVDDEKREVIPYLTRKLVDRSVVARIHRQKKCYQKQFTLKVYGTWKAAEDAAKEWVAMTLPTLPKRLSSKNLVTKRNQSGVVGVHYTNGYRMLKNGNKIPYPSYISRWVGCPVGVSWMFNTYGGEDNAFIHAVMCRRMETMDREVVEKAVREISNFGKTQILSLLKIRHSEKGVAPSVIESFEKVSDDLL